MPTLNAVIINFVVGDSLLLTRTIANIDPADGLASAVMRVKRYREDVDGSAIFTKTITVAQVAGQGQIVDTGSTVDGNGIASLLFELTPANTGRLVPNWAYSFDIECKTVAGAIYTPQAGLIIGNSQITITA